MAPVGALTLLTLAAADPTYFGDIRPLFERSCFGCHTAGVKMGSLDLETWAGVLRGGNNGTILVPGKPAESRLYTMLRGEAAPAMPMDGKVLPPAQIEAVRQWIASGARPGDASSRPAMQRIYSMTLAANGDTVLGRHGAVELVNSGSLDRRFLKGLDGPVRALAVRKDGHVAAAANVVGLFDGAGSLTKLPIVSAEALAFSRDGQLLAIGDGAGRIVLWDVARQREVRAVLDTGGAIVALAFTASGELISAGGGRFVRVWNASTGTSVQSLDAGPEGVTALAVSFDGALLAAAGADRRIRVWRLGAKPMLLAERVAHEDRILRLAWSRDGERLASAAADGVLKYLRAGDLTDLEKLPEQADWVVGLEFDSADTLSWARLDGTWHTSTFVTQLRK